MFLTGRALSIRSSPNLSVGAAVYIDGEREASFASIQSALNFASGRSGESAEVRVNSGTHKENIVLEDF